MPNGRCRMHDGGSNGARTPEGTARCIAAPTKRGRRNAAARVRAAQRELARAAVAALRRLLAPTQRDSGVDPDDVLDLLRAPTNRHGQRLRKRYGMLREHLFTFLDHPEVRADNNSSEHVLRPTVTYRKVTGGFRFYWGADFYAAVRSIIGTTARRGIAAYQAICATLQSVSVLALG